MQSSPITYMLDGKQYLLTGAGGVLFSWRLPESDEKPEQAAKAGN